MPGLPGGPLDRARDALIVAGPTASGKSGLALALARRLGGVVINADSMQVYRDLAILTARPGAADLAAAPHRLYGVWDGAERSTAARWRAAAEAELADARAAGRLPILTGGTGLYLHALTEGLAEIPPVPDAALADAIALHRRLGGAAFRERLAERDPALAARLEPGDSQRLVRAWAVAEATGRPLSAWQAAPPSGPPPGWRFRTILLDPPRAELYAACDRRFGVMMAAGAVDEVAALLARDLDPGLPVMKAVGVPELAAYLAGRIARDEAVEQAARATRRYAKRQVTWFRHQLAGAPATPCRPPVLVIDRQYVESLEAEIFSLIGESG